jgi:hypothetical protein
MKSKSSIDRQMIRDNPDAMAPGTLLVAESPKWEYKSVLLPRGADLSPYGVDGWELRSTAAQGLDQVMFYFIRQKQ